MTPMQLTSEDQMTPGTTASSVSPAEASSCNAKDATDLFRVFPSDGISRSGFCTECQGLSLAQILGQQIEGSYRGYLATKTVAAIQDSATYCQLCHCIAFSIKLSNIETNARYHIWLRPVEQPRSGRWLRDLVKLNGFQIISGRVEAIEKLMSRPGAFDSYERLSEHRWLIVEDLTLGFLRCEVLKGRIYEPIAVEELEQMTTQLTPDHYVLPPSYSSSHYASEMLRAWIKACDEQHSWTCCLDNTNATPKRSEREGPKRLLQIQIGNGETRVRLQKTGATIPSYIALSHCWGSVPITRTTVSSLDDFLQDIPLATLPRTFQDAIQITSQLGLSWLWIDSLCIIQDDPSDWTSEAPKMQAVYNDAYITIAASASASAAGGCFPHRPSLSDCVRFTQADPLHSTGAKQVILTPYPRELCSWSLEDEPLQSRAWSLQERLLSRRVLHCSSFEYIWFCRARPELEAHGRARSRNYFKSFLGTDINRHDSWDLSINGMFAPYSFSDSTEAERRWAECATDFSHRSLTFSFDKSIAIQGLVSSFAKSISSRYAYGMWESMFPEALAWMYTPKPSITMRGDDDQTYARSFDFSPAEMEEQRCFPDRAPSWSWLSVDGRIDLNYGPDSVRDPLSKDHAMFFYKAQREAEMRFEGFAHASSSSSNKRDPFKALKVTGLMIDIKLAPGLPLMRAGEAERKASALHNLKDWHWRLLDDTEIMNVDSRVRMDDPAFSISNTGSTKYAALILNRQSWVLLAQAAHGSDYRRVGVLTRIMEELSPALESDGEDYDEIVEASSDWQTHLEEVVGRASERTILIY